MADITKCLNESCPSKLNCYRFTAPDNQYWQSVCGFEVPQGEDKCDMFVDNQPFQHVPYQNKSSKS